MEKKQQPQSILDEPFYTRTVKNCDRMINAYLDSDGSTDCEIGDSGFVHEDENMGSRFIHNGYERIQTHDTKGFMPCDFFMVNRGEWLDQVQKYHKEKNRIRELNKPTVESNKRLARENHQIAELNQYLTDGNKMPLKPIPPMPYRISDESIQIGIRMTQCDDVLKRRTAGEWVALINERIADHILPHIARIVWWDFFSIRPATMPWVGLDEHLANAVGADADDDEIIDALFSIGYMPDLAIKRGKKPTTGNN